MVPSLHHNLFNPESLRELQDFMNVSRESTGNQPAQQCQMYMLLSGLAGEGLYSDSNTKASSCTTDNFDRYE